MSTPAPERHHKGYDPLRHAEVPPKPFNDRSHGKGTTDEWAPRGGLDPDGVVSVALSAFVRLPTKVPTTDSGQLPHA